MFQTRFLRFPAERKLGSRAIGLGVALLAEAVLLWLLLSLSWSPPSREQETVTVVDLEAVRPSAETPAPESQPEPEPAPAEQVEAPAPPVPAEPVPEAAPVPVVRPQPAPSPLPSIPLPRAPTAPPPPPAPARQAQAPGPAYGPPAPRNLGAGGDTARVGTAPNGEPLYAAAWYREPTDAELAGYLSTASGPGWGMIACRTVPDYRVEDCVGLEEYPQNSQILRAVLAAAWQFRVRPPRRGGVSLVGEWVRIRIEYRRSSD